MPVRLFVLGVALLSTAVAAAPADGNVHAIINIDVIPDDEAVGTQILSDYVREARHGSGVLSIHLIQQTSGSNHFILSEVFANQAAYEQWIQSPAVRKFRDALYPHLGSPWDERLGYELIPAPMPQRRG